MALAQATKTNQASKISLKNDLFWCVTIKYTFILFYVFTFNHVYFSIFKVTNTQYRNFEEHRDIGPKSTLDSPPKSNHSY